MTSLVIDDLQERDVQNLGWSGSESHLRAVERFLARARLGDVEYLVVRGLEGSPVAKGAIDFAEAPGAGTIVQLATHPNVQRLGIATALITSAETRIRRRGFALAMIAVEDDNPRARAMYERLGYAAVGRRKASWDAEARDGSVFRYETVLTQLEKSLVL